MIQKQSRLSAFTLVELIVVIVILGVLATIGFVSYSGYLGGARDGNRITQLKNINDSLNLYGSTKNLPLPDDYVSVTAGGDTVGYQGYAGENVLELINYISGGQDPKDGTYYTYYLTQDRKNLQLMALLEESGGLQTHNTINPLMPQTYAADYSNRFPKTYGKKLGVLVSNATATKNTPAQEMTTSDIDLATSTIYTAYLDDTNNIEASTAGDLLATIPNASCNRIKQTGGSDGNGTYKINPDGSGNIEVYCDMENGGGGWTAATMLADTTTQNLFDTGNTNKITSLTKNISSKGTISDMWSGNEDKDIMLRCFTDNPNLKNYEIPFLIYGYSKSDINNLEKSTKAGTTFSSTALQGSWKGRNISLLTTYAGSASNSALYIGSGNVSTCFALSGNSTHLYKTADTDSDIVNCPSQNNGVAASFALSTSNYCVSFIR